MYPRRCSVGLHSTASTIRYGDCKVLQYSHIHGHRSLQRRFVLPTPIIPDPLTEPSLAVNIATDVAFALLPIPIIWKLSVNLRTKITLIFILSLGFLACVAAIMRETLLVTFFQTPDGNFENAYALWNYAELAVGIIAACLPALRPLFAFLLDKASSTFASGQVGLSTRHKYYMQSNDINLSNVGKQSDSEGARGDGRYGVSVTSNGRDFYEERMPKRPMGKLEQSLTEGEGDSDENILPIQDIDRLEGGNNRIVKTTEVRVS